MVAALPPVTLYVTRWKALLAASVFGALLMVNLLHYYVWPTPEASAHPWAYQEPAKTILFLAVLLISSTLLLLALYWTLTPLPLLRLSTSEVIFRPFPLPAITIRWENVEHVFATVARRPIGLWRSATTLTLLFTLKSPRIETRNAQRHLRLEINLRQLSRRPEELVALVQTFHSVQWLPVDSGGAKAARPTKSCDKPSQRP
jgi:small-conductance mechanosensitive channel